VSAVPIQFLHAFTRTGQNVTASDLYGNEVLCDHWEGPSNFEYWTVGKHDPNYKNTGHDILFKVRNNKNKGGGVLLVVSRVRHSPPETFR
jgi:hypothetical protein